MVEVLVSAVLLVVMAMATFSLIDHAGRSSGQNRSRGVASNLAHADLDRMRQLSFEAASGVHQVSNPKVIDGVSYTVESRAIWTADEAQVLTCSTSDGSKGAQYLRISSSVSWTAMDGAKPVVAESLLTPRARDLDPTSGSLAFKVQDSTGHPVPGVAVTANGESLTTDDAGCVVFGRLPAGVVPVTYDKSGYVDRQGNATGTYEAQITAGQTAVKTTSFDLAVQLTPVTFKDESGADAVWMTYSVSSGTDFTASYPASPPAWAASGLPKAYTNTTPLYPFEAGYSVYAGNCAGNDPNLYDPSFSTRGDPLGEATVVAAPGHTAAASAFLRNATVTVSRGTTSGASLRVWFKPAVSVSQMNRPSGEHACDEVAGPLTVTTAGSPAAATASLALPYGAWSVCVDDGWRYRYRSAAVNAYYNTPAQGTPAPTVSADYPLLDTTATATSAPSAVGDVAGGFGTCQTRSW